ncbi:MAG: hypothetical protein ABMB14_21065, partial [Myxococcota bacterium]
ASAGPLRELDPEVRIAIRAEARDDNWADTESRLYDYAADAGWDDGRTERVRALLEQTTRGVGDRLRAVDGGTRSWSEVRTELRAFRTAQSDALRAEIGDDGFEQFAEGMDFWRYTGASRPGRPIGQHLATEASP